MTSILRWGIEWVERRIPDSLGDRLTEGLSLAVTEVDSPEWISDPETLSVVRFCSDIDTSRYVTGVEADPDAKYVVSTGDPFDRLEVPLTGIRSADRVVVEATFESEAEERETDRFVFENDDSFDSGERIEVSLETTLDATAATLSVDVVRRVEGDALLARANEARSTVLRRATGRDFVTSDSVRVGVPFPRQRTDAPPILLVSIDTLRWDRQEQLEPLVDTLGGDDVVVGEPRTQGHWTPPSHACMFTGVHPGDHRYVGLDDVAKRPIHPDLSTIGDIVHRQGYKTRGLVSHTRILPEVGFGHGFFQYRLENMSNWLTREYDARDKVNTMIDWVDRDVRAGKSSGLFYFLHVFDPHLPYVPPLPDDSVHSLALDDIDHYRNAITDVGVGPDYLELLNSELDVDPDVVETLRSYYDASVCHAADQVARLVDHLKRRGLFEDALIVVTGDHGEEFGERKTYTHNSLYDANIRPFMAVKPPADAGWDTPREADTIDILPTIAAAAGATAPEECQGRSWTDGGDHEVRITERIRPDWYTVSVEFEGVKGIFTYEDDYPDLPSAETLSDDPVQSEFYRIENVRAGDFTEFEPGPDLRRRLAETAREFAGRTPVVDADDASDVKVASDTEERLEHLGYM